MSPDLKYAILSLAILVYCLGTGNARDKGLNRGTKTVHAMILFCLALVGSVSLHELVWAVAPENSMIKTFYVRLGFLPAWFLLVHAFTRLIAGLVQLLLAYGLALREPLARAMFIRLIPIFYLVGCVSALRVVIKIDMKRLNRWSQSLSWLLALAAFLIIAVVYSVLWWFYARKNTKRLLFGLEASGSNSEQAAPVDSESHTDAAASSESSLPHDD